MRPIVAMLALLLGVGSAAAEDRCPTPAISLNIETPIPLSPPARAWLEAQMRQATAKVCAWWGPSFTGAFTIDVVEVNGPSMALIPAWRGERGRVMFPASRVRQGRAATIHEIVHVYAPNANRFLAEGLAVYAHEKLGGPVAFPNFGASLHTAAAPYAQVDVTALERLATPSRLELDRLADREAYLVAGSFVRFLIEQRGLDTFRRLYAVTPLVPGQRNAGAPARWEQIYGLDLDQLVRMWRNSLAQPI
jgi:hypothetical protein